MLVLRACIVLRVYASWREFIYAADAIRCRASAMMSAGCRADDTRRPRRYSAAEDIYAEAADADARRATKRDVYMRAVSDALRSERLRADVS